MDDMRPLSCNPGRIRRVPSVSSSVNQGGGTAIHSHMLTEQPRLIFVHFWANDDAQKLAKGLRAALEKTAIAKS
jgi:hypothetical protein